MLQAYFHTCSSLLTDQRLKIVIIYLLFLTCSVCGCVCVCVCVVFFFVGIFKIPDEASKILIPLCTVSLYVLLTNRCCMSVFKSLTKS